MQSYIACESQNFLDTSAKRMSVKSLSSEHDSASQKMSSQLPSSKIQYFGNLIILDKVIMRLLEGCKLIHSMHVFGCI